MQRQEINLYNAVIAPPAPKTFLTWKRFWICQIFFLCIFLLIYLISLINLLQLSNEKSRLLKQVQAAQEKFYELKSTYPPLFFSQDVSHSIDQLEGQLAVQEKILESIINRIPFSSQLSVLSKTIVPNVWLTGITIEKSGEIITLKGKSISMESLQAFLNNLVHDKSFLNFSLSVKNIENNSDKNAKTNINFEISLTKNKIYE